VDVVIPSPRRTLCQGGGYTIGSVCLSFSYSVRLCAASCESYAHGFLEQPARSSPAWSKPWSISTSIRDAFVSGCMTGAFSDYLLFSAVMKNILTYLLTLWIYMNFLPKVVFGPSSNWFHFWCDPDWPSMSFRGHSRPARSLRHKIDCSAEPVTGAAKVIHSFNHSII